VCSSDLCPSIAK